MSKVLHDSLKEKHLLLSISRDPSSTQRINKCLCIVLFKNTKAKERERLPTQQGEECNLTEILTKLTGSG